MALFNKLFSSRKKNSSKQQDTVCEKLFVFTKDQVRVVLFRECDFRGRKLLFDSYAIQKVPLSTTTAGKQSPSSQNATSPPNKLHEKYMEVSNGFGYQYVKPAVDIGHVAEMMFGAVAMSYRGTSLKIHSLKSPSSLMCSQIFPSPRYPPRGCHSTPSQSYAQNSVTSSQSLEQSLRLDDSGTSSVNSMSDRLSVHSSGSDTLLICRGSRSTPLDVPTTNTSTTISSNLTPSIIGDSGFSGEQSFNSINSGPQSLPLRYTFNEGEPLFSCGSLYKRWLRSAGTSLEHSMSSLPGSASADDCLIKSNPRTSKLGIAIVIELPVGQEQSLERFLMEHVALIESMMWRIRQGAEVAYVRHNTFMSFMFELATNTVQWLVDLLSGPQLAMHMWISLAPVCDKYNSINGSDSVRNSSSFTENSYRSGVNGTLSSCALDEKAAVFSNSNSSLNNSIRTDFSSSCGSSDTLDKSNDFTFLNLTKFLRNEWATVNAKNTYSCNDKNAIAEKCVTELCELLECVDVKHTNFFVSTLLTAVLTHHLGWVTTVLPPSSGDKEKVSKLHNPCNPLWGQLTDLYGAIGHPTKMAHTIITGTNKADLISKILNSLTYFIRCSDMERKCATRVDIKEENRRVDCICQQKSCIPKENYKKYEDHLREIEIMNLCASKSRAYRFKNSSVSPETIELCSLSGVQKDVGKQNLNSPLLKTSSITKTNSCLTDLNKISSEVSSKHLYPKLENLCSGDFETSKDHNHNIESSSHLLLNKVKSLGIHAVESFPVEKELTNAVINEKVRKLCRVPASAVLYHLETTKKNHQLVDIEEASEQIRKTFAPKKIEIERQMKSNSFNITTANQKTEPQMETENKCTDSEQKSVIFVLGDDEELIGLKKDNSLQLKVNDCSEMEDTYFPFDSKQSLPELKLDKDVSQTKLVRPTSLSLNKSRSTVFNVSSPEDQESDSFCNDSNFKDSDFKEYNEVDNIKPSTSWTCLELNKKPIPNHSSKVNLETNKHGLVSKESLKSDFNRSQSVPPENKKAEIDVKPTKEKKSKYRYSGVKFNFQQYPQIVTNYMRSKNLELSHLPFAEKAMKLASFEDYATFDFSNYDSDGEEMETLQTPSNASELEFTSDLVTDNYEVHHAKEKIERKTKTFVRNHLPNTIVKEPNSGEALEKSSGIKHPLQINDKANNAMFEHEENNSSEEECITDLKPKLNKMEIIELPMPKSEQVAVETVPLRYTSTLMRGLGERYMSDMVLQGTSAPKSEWESILRRDLSLAARRPLLDQPIDEAVAIVANTDTWEVQLLSSHTYVVDRGSSGVRVGMSQLVANMLESLLHMWKLHTPPEYCIMHIEQRLQEFCTLSKALAELLLATEFCSMELLTSVLQLEVNDVPLLLAVASTHSPQVTQKYGLSFQ